MPITTQVKGEHVLNHADVEGEYHISNPLVDGEPTGQNPDNNNDQTNYFHDVIDNISIAGEGSKADDIFEDVPLVFDPAYPPMDKQTRDHQKEQVVGNPNSGVLTRA